VIDIDNLVGERGEDQEIRSQCNRTSLSIQGQKEALDIFRTMCYTYVHSSLRNDSKRHPMNFVLESNQPNPSPEANAEGDMGVGDTQVI